MRFLPGFCILFALATSAQAGTIAFKLLNANSAQPQVQLFYNGKPGPKAAVDVLAPGTPYFHWASGDKRVESWTKAGRVPLEEMENRVKGTGDRLAMGGGVYTSYDAQDSSSFGKRLIVFNAPQKLFAVQDPGHDHFVEFLGRKGEKGTLFNRMNAALRQAGIHGANYNLDSGQHYTVWFSPTATSRLHEATLDDIVRHAKSLEPHFLFKIDRYAPIQAHPLLDAYLKTRYPSLLKILHDQPLTKSEREQLEFMFPNMGLWPLDRQKSAFALKIQRALDAQRESEVSPPADAHSDDAHSP